MGLFSKNNISNKEANTGNSAGLNEAQMEKTMHRNLSFTALEQYKLLRTNISFAIPEDVSCPVIGITSAIRGEGKSTTAINLAYVMAESGKKVLLIDGDMRLPSIHHKLKLDVTVGLPELLMDPRDSYEEFASNLMDNLYIIPSITSIPNSSEVLASDRMKHFLEKVRENYDAVIMDLPPVNLVSDTLAVSPYLTGFLIVVKEGFTTNREIDECIRLINLAEQHVLGFVITNSGSHSGRYYKYKSKKYYKYYK